MFRLHHLYKSSLPLMAVVVAGCVQVPPVDEQPVVDALQARIEGMPAQLAPGGGEAQQPLTLEHSLRLALQHNQALRAQLAALGVAQADLTQASLLPNPVLAVSALDPDGGGRWQLDLGLSQSLLEILTRSLRVQLAEAEFQRVQLETASVLLASLQEIREAYIEAVAAAEKADKAGEVTRATANAASLSVAFHEAGNIPEGEQLRARAEAAEWRNQSEWLAAEAAAARSALAARIGLPDAAALSLPSALPAYPQQAVDCQAMQQAALARRLDLQEAQLAQDQAAQALALARRTQGMTVLEAGVDAEREFDGADHVGPSLAWSLPLFDQGQAQVARQAALLQQATASRAELANRIPHEVQQACVRRAAAIQVAERWRTIIVPHRERLVALALEEYQFMLMDGQAVLRAKQEALSAEMSLVEAAAAVWLSELALSRAVGADVALAQNRSGGAP